MADNLKTRAGMYAPGNAFRGAVTTAYPYVVSQNQSSKTSHPRGCGRIRKPWSTRAPSKRAHCADRGGIFHRLVPDSILADAAGAVLRRSNGAGDDSLAGGFYDCRQHIDREPAEGRADHEPAGTGGGTIRV